MLQFRALGPLEVERDGELVNLGGHRQRSVLAVLLLRAGEAVSADRLIDAVWEESPPAAADTTLRSYVSTLRKALEGQRDADDPPRVLRTTSNGYLLDVPEEAIDARRFEHLLAQGRDRRAVGRWEDAEASWAKALRLWRGEALQDFAYADFAQAEASRLTELRLSCTEELFQARLELGRHDEVVGDLEAFSEAHPSRERALRLRMLALYRCGRQADALAAYEQGRRRLAEELGIDPSPELRELHEQIVRQDPVLAAPTLAGSPTGKHTVTFVLGDVELSTERLRTLGNDYAGVLERHRLALREAFSAHGGHAIRAYGDETFAAFDCATDAVAAAVAAQLALSSFEPDEAQRLPVRMGVHTGEAAFSAGEYVGLAVHLAARIMAAAHGGQVLVSLATKDLYETEEGAEATFHDTGMHNLKDISEPVRLFQLVHPALRRDFPPLRTLSAPAGNLPQRPTSFIGRERDIAEIETALADARMVTLTGVGGVGKTRLALEAGRHLRPRYADGVWFCELAPVVDADGLVHSVATTLKVEQQRGRPVRDSLLAALRQRESLVILDNCEHLLESIAELVEDIVASCPNTDVLATSREVVGVEGERSRPVRSLKASSDDVTADAMRLFCDRARDVRPDFILDERNAPDVADICNRLDGVPLAIELAAARVTSLSPAQIAKRLEEGFHFLRSGRRAAVDRHRTLHGAIDWSYAMLSEAEARLFDRLSVFAGGFTLEAGEAVCGRELDIDVADGLASLVAKSMVNADVTADEARYFLLETMRQYAQDRLAEREEAENVLRAHAHYFVRMLEAADWFNGDSERLVRQIMLEFDNVRAAHAWTITAGDVDLALRLVATDPLSLMGEVGEVFEWAEQAVALPGAEAHPLFPVVLATTSRRPLQHGDRETAERIWRRAIEMVGDPDDPRKLATYAAAGGSTLFFEGRIDEFRQGIDEMIGLARAAGDVAREAFALWGRALGEAYAGEHAVAIEAAEAAWALARERSTAAQAWALYGLGEVLRESGELERALEALERSIVLSRANEMRFQAGVGMVSAASIRDRLGDQIGALEMLREVIDYWRFGGLWIQQWVTLRNLAELFGRLGADEPATALVAASETSTTAVPSYGAQGQRLEALKAQLADRMGVDAFSAAWERGRSMSDEEAVAYAKAEIARALELHSLEPLA